MRGGLFYGAGQFVKSRDQAADCKLRRERPSLERESRQCLGYPTHQHPCHLARQLFWWQGHRLLVPLVETLEAGQGAFVVVPTGVAHTFSNPTERPARFLCTFTPHRYLSYFQEASQLSQATASPSPQQMAELMARYDTEVVS